MEQPSRNHRWRQSSTPPEIYHPWTVRLDLTWQIPTRTPASKRHGISDSRSLANRKHRIIDLPDLAPGDEIRYFGRKAPPAL
jgi:hypothetical protein